MIRSLIAFALLINLSCTAAPPHITQQARNLQLILHQADDAYYNKNSSVMSDAAYDALREQYNHLVSTYPELAESRSPGASPSKTALRIPHGTPILSLQKATSDGVVLEFIKTCGTEIEYCVEPKIDGLTVVLHYRNGLLTRALTRGDGINGTDITAAVLASGAVPATLNNAPAQLDVRGEAFMGFADFKELNRRRKASGEPALKSPRNTAAGTLKLNDYAEISRRNIHISIFDLLASDTLPPTQTETLAFIQSCGLPVIENHTIPGTRVLPAIEKLNQARKEFPFPTDGIVIRVNDRARYNSLGFTTHHPRGALARKYKMTPAETRLLRVDWSRGTTGKLTPIAVFEPVELDGATIQRASLYNLNYLRAMDLKIGDWIRVIRSAGSIPEIIGVCPGRRTGSETRVPDPPEI